MGVIPLFKYLDLHSTHDFHSLLINSSQGQGGIAYKDCLQQKCKIHLKIEPHLEVGYIHVAMVFGVILVEDIFITAVQHVHYDRQRILEYSTFYISSLKYLLTMKSVQVCVWYAVIVCAECVLIFLRNDENMANIKVALRIRPISCRWENNDSLRETNEKTQ